MYGRYVRRSDKQKPSQLRNRRGTKGREVDALSDRDASAPGRVNDPPADA